MRNIVAQELAEFAYISKERMGIDKVHVISSRLFSHMYKLYMIHCNNISLSSLFSMFVYKKHQVTQKITSK